MIRYKNKMWLSCKELGQYVDADNDNLKSMLKSVYYSNCKRKGVLFRNNEYFLAKDSLDNFIKKFSLIDLRNVPEQDSNWVVISRLSVMYHKTRADMVRVARELKNKESMRGANGESLIQFRKTSCGRHVSLCLFNSDEARRKLAQALGKKEPIKYTMQYNWTDMRYFPDSVIDKTICKIMECYRINPWNCREASDALMSTLPKSPGYESLFKPEKTH